MLSSTSRESSRVTPTASGHSADRWLFASAPTNVMAAFSAQLDFRFANEGGSFLHNLRTVVLDPQRRIHRQFDGNKRKAQELADVLAEAAMGKSLVESTAAGTVVQ